MHKVYTNSFTSKINIILQTYVKNITNMYVFEGTQERNNGLNFTEYFPELQVV
jgi:hypothetical protein